MVEPMQSVWKMCHGVTVVECECTDPDHHIIVDGDDGTLGLTFSVSVEYPFWDKTLSRFKTAWKVLTGKPIKLERTIILTHDASKHLAEVLSNVRD